MNLVEKIRQLGHELGLTIEEREGSSSVFCEETTVKSMESLLRLIQLLTPFHEDDCYILFQGETGEIEINVPAEIYEKLHEGDKVRLFYRNVLSIASDYVPPDFDQKEFIETKRIGYEFVEAELLKGEKAE